MFVQIGVRSRMTIHGTSFESVPSVWFVLTCIVLKTWVSLDMRRFLCACFGSANLVQDTLFCCIILVFVVEDLYYDQVLPIPTTKVYVVDRVFERSCSSMNFTQRIEYVDTELPTISVADAAYVCVNPEVNLCIPSVIETGIATCADTCKTFLQDKREETYSTNVRSLC